MRYHYNLEEAARVKKEMEIDERNLIRQNNKEQFRKFIAKKNKKR